MHVDQQVSANGHPLRGSLSSSVAEHEDAPGFWLVRAGRPLLHLSGSVFAYTYKMLASAALQRRILATSWHRCTG